MAIGHYREDGAFGEFKGSAFRGIFTVQVIDVVNRIKYEPIPFVTKEPPEESFGDARGEYSFSELLRFLDESGILVA